MLYREGAVSAFGYFYKCPRGGAPFLEVLQYQVDAWSGRSKLLFQLPAPKIHLIYCPRIEDVSDIKLIRTDTTLDLSQKAEKRYRGTARRCHRPAVLHVALRVTGSPLTPGLPSLASLTVLWRRYTRRSSRSCILHTVNEKFRIRCGFVVLGRKCRLESACPALCRQEGVARRDRGALGTASGRRQGSSSLVERRDPTGGGAGWLARGTRATSCWPRVFLKTRSQDSLARNARAAVCYRGLRLRREGLRRVRCVEGASRPGGRRMVWMRRVGPGRGRGSLQLQRPCPSVPLGTKAIPGFLPKAPSAKDLVSLPLLLSCGPRWRLRLSRNRL